jgi:hypothetical protein
MYDGKIGVIELYVGYICFSFIVCTVDKNIYQITNNSKHLRNPVAKVIFHVVIAETFCGFK